MNKAKVNKKRLVLSLAPETIRQANILAATAGTTVSQLFENLINGGKK